MLSPSDLKKGSIAEIDGMACRVEKVVIQTPSSRGSSTIYKVRARNLKTKQKVDKSFRGGDSIAEPNFEKRSVQYLYKDNEHAHFMDTENFNQFAMSLGDLEEEMGYLVENMEGIDSLVIDNEVIGIELPPTVELAIAECDPAARGNSATSRAKSATLETGLVVQVPEHLSSGEVVRVDVGTGKFVCRVAR
jgi:elongation factor P